MPARHRSVVKLIVCLWNSGVVFLEFLTFLEINCEHKWTEKVTVIIFIKWRVHIRQNFNVIS
jgi:hypothetical protein